jgi:hypothetical protein
MGEQIKITIRKGGEKVEFDCNGFQGESCNVTTAVEQALGLVDRKDKDDLFKNEIQTNQYNTN